MPKFTYDPDVVGRLMDELDAALYRISELARGVDVDASGRARHNDPNKAQLSRELLRSQDLTRLIQAELSVTYWRFKGHNDPREEVTREQAG